MTASQRPDAGHAPLTSPAAAGSGPTGHDKAVELVAKVLTDEGGAPGSSLHSWRCEYPDRYGDCDCLADTAQEVLAALRAALAAGDADVAGPVAEALGLRERVVVDHEIGYFDENGKTVLQFGGTLHQCEDVMRRHPDWFRPDSRILVKRSTWWQSSPVGRWEVSGE